MIPEIGHFALVLGLCLALVQGILPMWGAQKGNAVLMSVGRPAALGHFLFMGIAFTCLLVSFVGNDFSVLNVAQHSNSNLPVFYRMAASWGSHEGSMLLWAFLLAFWALAVTVFSARLPDDMVARVLGVMGLVSVGFILFLLLTSNPFLRLLPAAPDGRDLNPLLQDPGMVFHPPLLYMGYVGFSVAFAFAIAALIGGKLDAAWARWSRPWTTVAWLFLTLGIALGSYWAYYELGWGGWWFWDPVENASFMPWLVGTALIHSLAVTEKRGSFKSWTVLLAIVAFSLSLLGTFLVRSGVLTSVHAFATDPERGVFILGFLVLVVGVSLTLYAWRAPSVGLGGSFGLISRESMLLVNNVLLSVVAGSVLLGTLYPMFLDALGLGKISVGPPYFETVFVPLMAPLVALMALGPYARWKKADLGELARKLRLNFILALVTAAVLPFVMGHWSSLAAFGLLLASWLAYACLGQLISRLREKTGSSLITQISALPASYLGMQLAHFGVAVFIVGVTMVKTYETDKDVKMKVGESVTIESYRLQFMNIGETKGPNYIAARGVLDVYQGDKKIDVMHPEKRIYMVQQMPMTESAIRSGVFGDLYVSLGEAVAENEWIVQVRFKPFVNWIWIGCILMALGGLLAASDRRYRVGQKQIQDDDN